MSYTYFSLVICAVKALFFILLISKIHLLVIMYEVPVVCRHRTELQSPRICQGGRQLYLVLNFQNTFLIQVLYVFPCALTLKVINIYQRNVKSTSVGVLNLTQFQMALKVSKKKLTCLSVCLSGQAIPLENWTGNMQEAYVPLIS